MRRWHLPTQALLLGNALFMLLPIGLMLLSAFKTNAELFANPFALPEHWSLDNIRQVWDGTSFPRYLLNSMLVTGASLVLILVTGTMAAYAIARYPFRGSGVVLLLFVAGLMVPLKLAVIPLFLQLDRLGLFDTRAGLVLVYTAMGLPSAVFILTGFLRTLPGELEQSARIDGASELRIMLQIMLPLARPALAIAAIQERGADLERLLLSAGVHHDRRAQDLAAGADGVHGRVQHGLGRAVRGSDLGSGADRGAISSAEPSVHRRHDTGGDQIGVDRGSPAVHLVQRHFDG